MIISVNPKPSMQEFADLMRRTDILLNKEALSNPEYYKRRGGSPLEDDVKVVLDECAKGTTFAGTIDSVSRTLWRRSSMVWKERVKRKTIGPPREAVFWNRPECRTWNVSI